MKIEEIEIGSKWEDCLGKAKKDKNGNTIKGIERREVAITNKTSNSVEYIDGGGYMSWISIEDFCRVERTRGKVRFEKV